MKNKLLLFALLLSVMVNILFIYTHYIHQSHTAPAHIHKQKMQSFLNRQEIFAVLPIDTNSVVFLGDSHTQYFELSEYFTTPNIKNRGIGGDRTDQVLSRLRQVTDGKPRKIFIEIGTNDFLQGVTVDSCFQNIKQILATIKNKTPRTNIYFQNMIPCDKIIGQDTILNQCARAYCIQNNIPYIDLYDSLYSNGGLDPAYDCGDGIHLNGKGYLRWKQIINKYVNE